MYVYMCCYWVVYFRKIKTSLPSICWRSMMLLSTLRACLIAKLNVFTSTRGNYWTVCISLLFIIVRTWFLFTESVLPSSLSFSLLSLSPSLSLSSGMKNNPGKSYLPRTVLIGGKVWSHAIACTGVQCDIVLILQRVYYYLLYLVSPL